MLYKPHQESFSWSHTEASVATQGDGCTVRHDDDAQVNDDERGVAGNLARFLENRQGLCGEFLQHTH